MIWRTVAATAVLFLAAFADGGEPEPLPDVVRYQRADVVEPVWVSEKAALDERGELRLDLFSARVQAGFRQSLQKNADGTCHHKLIEPAALPHPLDAREREVTDSALDFAIANASIVVAGKVVSATRGFYHGFPGVLAGIAEIERLKEVAPLSHSSVLYVFFPGATIQTRKGAICSSALPSSPRTPEPGDRLVVFPVGAPVDESRRILGSDVRRNVLVQSAGTNRLVDNDLAGTIEDGRQLDTIIESIRKHSGRTHVPRRIRQ